ncbi:O-acetylhomoserine/O-acetylserine sulfhydrylase [Corynebacterium sp. TAE3-ERU12]|uniref:O-acetylhomoserine/O-acetylserine sulfhydrylase n=1 Tax=Corynebacterium sp. TAE3-ERU12 TaxID=2849491 RepID=UPI001C4922A2|nr:O-acetylhomoserine/O-acetylserine sulfhydrylase [Corynebacterium sp. TAE3-ERU12]MBV7294749.1 O-acetylhomoserine/O-acetylserine sulfhydrylase [Corynebacterium sp. TAE3-ERU12]
MSTRYDNSEAASWGFTTRQIHAGQPVDSDNGSRNLPIHMSTAFVFDDAQTAANRFDLSEPGFIYTRLNNPTVAAVEERFCALEGGVHAVLFGSGMAAETAAILNLVRAGDQIVTSPRLYGGTDTLFSVTLPRLGVEVTYVDNPDDPKSWAAAVQDNTRAFFAEAIANPQADVLDVPLVAEVAHDNQVPLIVDNTIPTAWALRPLELGADIVIASTTKFYTGNGSALGGVLVDGGSFDWTVQRDGKPVFHDFVTPDPAYHGLKYADLGPAAYGLKARVGLLRDTGAAPSPFNAWLIAQGLDTLSLRMRQHNTNAQKVAEYLEEHPLVRKVAFPGLPSSPWNDTLTRLDMPGGGAVLTFDIAGEDGGPASRERAWAFIDALKLHSNVANIGDVRSLVVHPASTTHSQCSDEQNAAAGVTQATVRLSVGIEDIEDIIADLDGAFAAL